MAQTFTGLKLQGDIGKFGQVELSDISGYCELPDGKVGYFEGERNEERVVKVEWPDGRVEEF